MERIFFRKIELWVVGLIAVFAILAMVGFGVIVRNAALGQTKYGRIGEIALNVATIPNTLKRLLKNEDRMKAIGDGQRFKGLAGWYVGSAETLSVPNGYLLLSRYDGDLRTHVVELVDLATQKMLHQWQPDAADLFSGIPIGPIYENAPIRNATFRTIHPIAFENGDILVKDHHTPLARIDSCSQAVWTNSAIFHHASELDHSGTIWSPSSPPPTEDYRPDFHHDGFASISPEGEIIAEYSLADVLLDNGYEYLLAGMNQIYHRDPIHLNDVQPVLNDGTYWKKGDLFLSLRHKSTVALFRPSTGKIIWLRTGPWFFQHDVDVLSDGVIAVFNNNMNQQIYRTGDERLNEIHIYDFASDTVTQALPEAFAREEIRTPSEGLYTFMPSGHLMIEEENHGRILFIDSNGKKALEYINGAENGFPYRLGWSRIISQQLGDVILSALDKRTCAN